MPEKKSSLDNIVDFLASVKLALVILIALAVAAVGGTIVPQNEPLQNYLRGYGPKFYTFLSYLDMYDMYNSWWFRTLMALLVVNLVVCSLKRLPATRLLARPANPQKISVGFLEKQAFNISVILPGDPEKHQQRLTDIFSRRFGRPVLTKRDWGSLCTAHKGAYSRYGVYLVHASLLFIVLGGLVGGLLGFSAFLNLTEGQTADQVIGRRPAAALTLPFSVRLDKFVVRFYNTGAPAEFRSDVTIIENGQEVKKAGIRVNHPLTWRGVTFYQSGYGPAQAPELELKVTRRSDGKVFNFKGIEGRFTQLPEDLGAVGVEGFMEDVMNTGPAARLFVRPLAGAEYTAWAFKDRPDFVGPQEGPLAFELTDYHITYWTGLGVNRDPGVPFIWIGCGLMLGGILITFFLAHQKLYLALIPHQGKTRVVLAGSSHRNPGSFKIKFEALAEEISSGLPAVKSEKRK